MTADSLRERLRSRNADSSLLNSSQVSNKSAFEDKQSPVCKSRYVNDNQRLESNRITSLENRIKYHIILLTVFVVDHFVLNSALTSFILLFGYFSSYITSYGSAFISLYALFMIICHSLEIKFPNVFNQLLESTRRTTPTPVPVRATPSPGAKNLDTSMQNAELSWIDAHKFGTPVLKSLQKSPSHKNAPIFSHALANTSVSDSSGILEENKSLGWKSPAAYGKPMESIHTRKQLDVLLRSNQMDAPIDMNASQSYMSSIWSVFDLSGRRGSNNLNNSYQLSEEIDDEANANSSYRMKIGKNGRTEVKMLRKGKDGEREDEDEDELVRLHKIMNAAKNAPGEKTGILKRSNSIDRGGIRGRRRSHSSPDRTTGNENENRYRTGELLTEEQQKKAEFLTRAWIRSTIILPLANHIKEVNKILEKEHANPPLRIGSSSVDALKLAAIERDALKTSNLPFLLPFLNIHSNQAYLVSRINELSASQFMDVYKWNSGGSEPADEVGGRTTRLIRREWNDSLPTDAILVFELFLAYMDAQLNSNCLVGDNRLDQPFTSRFCVKSPRKPTSAQRAAFSFYLHLVSASPPHIEFVYIEENGHPCKCNVLRQTSNVFRAIAQFVHFVKQESHGYLDQTSIGPSGINLTSVLS